MSKDKTKATAKAAEEEAAAKAAEEEAAAKAAEEEAAAKAAEEEAAAKAAEEEAAAKAASTKGKFFIADGAALTTKRGILSPGDEVKTADLANGQDGIDAHVKSGHIVKG